VLYREARAKSWESMDLETAMDLVAERVWERRERTFAERQDGQVLMHTKAIAHLGGATLAGEYSITAPRLDPTDKPGNCALTWCPPLGSIKCIETRARGVFGSSLANFC
jgi:hypothetical protein